MYIKNNNNNNNSNIDDKVISMAEKGPRRVETLTMSPGP